MSPFVKIGQSNDDEIPGLYLKVEGISIIFIKEHLPCAAQHNVELVTLYTGWRQSIEDQIMILFLLWGL